MLRDPLPLSSPSGPSLRDLSHCHGFQDYLPFTDSLVCTLVTNHFSGCLTHISKDPMRWLHQQHIRFHMPHTEFIFSPSALQPTSCVPWGIQATL